MNKAELQDALYTQVNKNRVDPVSKSVVCDVCDALFETIKDIISDARIISVRGFGTFEVMHTAARKARNPKTGAPMQIPAKQRVKFRPSEVLKNIVNKK